MTLLEAYEAILAVAARPSQAARVAEMRRAFETSTGASKPDDEARTRAFWDDALTRQGYAKEIASKIAPEAAAWVPGMTNAHRGLFRVATEADRGDASDDAEQLVLIDVWGGAAFVVHEIDEASKDAIDAASAPFDARLVARPGDAVVIGMLPGAIFHPAEAEEALGRIVAIAREKTFGTNEALDAFLRMELALRTLSRVKPAYAYRPEALAVPRAAAVGTLAVLAASAHAASKGR